MPSPVDLRVGRAAVHNQRQQSALARHVGEVYHRTFRTLPGVDDAAAERWLRFAVPTMKAAKTQTAYSQLAYTREVARWMHLPATATIDVAAIVGDSLEDRYMAPVIAARSWVAEGNWFTDAIEMAANQAREMARSDIADTSRDAAVASMGATPGVTHYRRVPSDSACDFCLLIAGQRYTTEDLAPAHNNCTCGVAPITDEADPTFERQQLLSKDLYADQQRVDDAHAEEDRLSEEEPA